MVDKRLKKIYEEFPDFTPNLTPEEMFRLGSFGGTYWRPIKSNITSKNYKNQHLEFPKSWWSGLPDKWLVNEWKDYDTSINKYKIIRIKIKANVAKRRLRVTSEKGSD